MWTQIALKCNKCGHRLPIIANLNEHQWRNSGQPDAVPADSFAQVSLDPMDCKSEKQRENRVSQKYTFFQNDTQENNFREVIFF